MTLFAACALGCDQLLGLDIGQSAGGLDPANNEWRTIEPMTTSRIWHTATPLGNGKVLVTGGRTDHGADVEAVELYEPQSAVWTPVAPVIARSMHAATALGDGRVLITGGQSSRDNQTHRYCEVFEPAGNTWASVAPMWVPRAGHTATLLSNGGVLVAGGSTGAPLDSVEIFDPATHTWAPGPPLNFPRYQHTATKLWNGQVLVLGGADEDSDPGDALVYAEAPLSAAEVYTP